MQHILESILDCVGNTPVVRLNRMCKGFDVVAKLEYLSPSGSTKDRYATHFLHTMESEGRITPGVSTIAEATTGSTGIAFSLACAVKGYALRVVMPSGMSDERKKLIRILGAQLQHTTGNGIHIDESLAQVKKLEADAHTISPHQFENELNVHAHAKTTGRELIAQCEGKIDAFVAGVGTGGTLIGVAHALEAAGIDARIVAVEPASCALLSGGNVGAHEIEGIADGIVPPIISRHRDMIDEVITVTDEQAFAWTKRLIREEGMLAGISSGANVFAADRMARRLGPSARVATVLPDTAMKYFSTRLFDDAK